MKTLNPKTKKYLVIGITFVFMMFIYFVQQNLGKWFQASLLQLQILKIPFEGTVYPIDQVPDWVNWNGDNSKDLFSSVPKDKLISMPRYNLKKLQTPLAGLNTLNTLDDATRNAKVTYSVVYLGNYLLDHIEDIGSHPAVDIRTPVGTPIRSIANGIVTKSYIGNGGFGNHIIIMHPSVPDLNDESKKTNLYSIYAHLSKIHVKEGDEVKKGQIIGISGNTGTSTAPHLHFQLDRDEAPWHPYWPFTSAEMKAAGLTFFEAINSGLNIHKAKEFTVNPLKYVEKYLSKPEDTGNIMAIKDTIGESEETENNKNTGDNEDNKKLNEKTDFTLKITAEKFSLAGNSVPVTITLYDKDGDIIKDASNIEETFSINATGQGTLSQTILNKTHFSNGKAKIYYSSTIPEDTFISIGNQTIKITFISKVKPIAGFEIESDGNYIAGVPEEILIKSIDAAGEFIPEYTLQGAVTVSFSLGEGKLNPSILTLNDFKNGTAKISFISNNKGKVKIKAQNGAIVGTSEFIYEEKEIFTDIKPSHKNYKAIKYLKTKGIVNGYPDGSFKPGQTVSRVESLKMILLALNIVLDDNVILQFKDTDNSAWYASYLSTALKLNIVKGYPDNTFKPANIVNRAELLKILLKTSDAEIPKKISEPPYSDVTPDIWFAPYASFAKKESLIDAPDGLFKGEEGMTRAQVAETIYRLIAL